MTTLHLMPHQFKPQERAAALSAGLTTYFTGKPCKNGHIAYRCTANGICSECGKAKQKSKMEKRLEREPDYYKKMYEKNAEKYKKASSDYRKQHPEKVRLSCIKSNLKRKPLKAAAEMKRQASKLSATPKWLSKDDLNLIKSYYVEAQKPKTDLGIVLSVDHIVPLRGKNVCGLHVPWNLCLRTKSDNSRKNNKLTEDVYLPKQQGILVTTSALPWNLKKEQNEYSI